jgi:hypothetical protein
MQLPVPLADLHAALGFLDSMRESAGALDSARAAELYAFLWKGPTFDVTQNELVIACPDSEKARSAGANRSLSNDESSYQHARDELATELAPLQRTLPPAKAEEFLARTFQGLMAQLFNLPLDMDIERRLADRHRRITSASICAKRTARRSQFMRGVRVEGE